uniref:Uncharacterized protein n=1 Tax=Cannabis sativa TaxID=3483 RepID=A0A803QDR6_CANSA
MIAPRFIFAHPRQERECSSDCARSSNIRTRELRKRGERKIVETEECSQRKVVPRYCFDYGTARRSNFVEIGSVKIDLPACALTLCDISANSNSGIGKKDLEMKNEAVELPAGTKLSGKNKFKKTLMGRSQNRGPNKRSNQRKAGRSQSKGPKDSNGCFPGKSKVI